MSDQRQAEDPGIEAWELLLRTQAALVPVLSDQLEAATGIPLSWYDVLLELARSSDHRLTMSELGGRVVLSRSHSSRIVTAMEQAGLVEKSSDETDKRTTWASLTRKGHREFRAAATVYLAAIETHFASHLTAAQSRAIAKGLKSVLANSS